MRVVRGLVIAFTVLCLLVSANPAVSVGEGRHKSAAPDKYNPPEGVKFNNPYGPLLSERANFRHILRAINSTKRGEKIRIASWNVRSPGFANAVIAAHNRGVSVRILMDRVNAYYGVPNRDVTRIQAALKEGNKRRDRDMVSWLRKCVSSCRATSGIAHTKFYLFSKVAKKQQVVMFGSNNLTDLAATIQWNDIYTFTGRQGIYDEFNGIFKEMSRDRKVRGGAYRAYPHEDFDLFFYPYTGAVAEAAGDPDMNRLNAIRCQGATGGAGYKGRTKIRIAQTAMYGNRGLALANKLAALRREGCDIRLVYAMFGNQVLRILRAAHIPLTHLAWDRNEDGVYDRYIHMKSMTISGVYGDRTDAFVTVNGSANWTAVALASDEVVGEFRSRPLTVRYQRWIDFLFTHRPQGWGPDRGGAVATDRDVRRLARTRGLDPYAIIKQDL